MVTMPRIESPHVPLEYTTGSWQTASPKTIMEWSAVGFFFARTLQKTLNVPVGIISAAWGGAPVQGFMSKELLNKLGEGDHGTHSHMYNGVIYPVRKYTIKGFIWSQGEANVGQENNWLRLIVPMIQDWRELWGLGNISFFLSLIAPYEYTQNGFHGALMRDAQIRVPKLVPNCGIVNTIDLVLPNERHQVHPGTKKPVGERFAWLALNHVYGFGGISTDGNVYEGYEIKGPTIWLYLSSRASGFSPYDDIRGLEMAGEDRVLFAATGKMAWKGGAWPLVLWSPNVTKPVAVRYCFKDFEIGNFMNSRNMPVFPFRTDNWPLPKAPDDFYETVISKIVN
jgi:sialate O-acetylesterase